MKKSFKTNVLLLISSLLVGGALAEGALRILGYYGKNFARADLTRGWELAPGTEGWWTEEGRSYVRINDDGLRDEEHALTKSPGVVRIAVIGDSYTEARQVPVEKTFWKILEHSLESCSRLQGKTAEVINFGVTGYGTAQELLTLRNKVWLYNPDVIILAVFTGNDITDNSMLSQHTSPPRPYFVLKDGKLVLDKSYLDDPGFRFRTSFIGRLAYAAIDHSRLVQLVDSVRRAQHRGTLPQALMPGGEVGLDQMVYVEPAKGVWQDAWRTTEALFGMMFHEVRDHDSQFLLVTLSNSLQVNPDQRLRERFAERLGIRDLFYPERRIEGYANAEGIPVLVLAPRLQRWAELNNTCVHGFDNAEVCGGHWNEYGHRLAGKWIADKICQETLQ